MANIYISKIKVRRGTDEQRRHVRFDQGEIVSTLDTNRLYIGNGVLSGGNSVSTLVHPPLTQYSSLSNTIAEVGDLVSVNSIWYQLTANPYSTITNWGDMRTKVSSEFEYNVNTINLTLGGLSASKINPQTVTNGVYIKDGKIQANYNTNFFEISSYQLSLKNGAITQRELLSSSLGDGLSGGNGEILKLKVQPSDYYFESGYLKPKFTIYDTLTGNSSLNTTNSLSSIFNGSIEADIPGLEITNFTAISSNGISTQTLTLSSAGFLTFEENQANIAGKNIRRFAIPIFTY